MLSGSLVSHSPSVLFHNGSFAAQSIVLVQNIPAPFGEIVGEQEGGERGKEKELLFVSVWVRIYIYIRMYASR